MILDAHEAVLCSGLDPLMEIESLRSSHLSHLMAVLHCAKRWLVASMVWIPTLVVGAIQSLTSHKHHGWMLRSSTTASRLIGAQKYLFLWIWGFHAVGGHSLR
jgi:hypothetical protein